MVEMKLDTRENILGEVEEILEEPKDLERLLHRELVINALKCKRDDLDILDLKVINRAIGEFRYAAHVFKPYRKIRKVSFFGSARVPQGSPYYDLAVQFGKVLAEEKNMVITGAASGIMRAGIEGATPQNSFGVNILLPFETANTIIKDDPKLITFRYFFTRKVFFVMEADAIALFPGGFGTLDECFEILTLLQTGKSPPMPLVLMELKDDDYWERWDRLIRDQLLVRGYISEEDFSFYKIVHSPREAADLISDYYSTYHSLRQVRENLVIRLEKDLSDDNVRELNVMFHDLIATGEIKKTKPLVEEEDEPDLLQKPRLVFRYDRKNAGRLNEMILKINEMNHVS